MKILSYLLLLLSLISTSTNAQLQWRPTNSLQGYPVETFHSYEETLFIGMYGGGIQKTTDNGRTWISCNEGLTNYFIRGFAQQGDTLFVGTEGAGVFYSTNLGANWQITSIDSIHRNVWSMGSSGKRLIAGTYAGIYLSDDSGETWRKANLPQAPSTSSGIIFCIYTRDPFIFAGTGLAVFISPDGGDSWYMEELDTNLDINTITSHQEQIWIGTSGDGLFVADFTDESLSDFSSYTDFHLPVGNIFSMASSDTSLILATSVYGVFRDSIEMNEGIESIEIIRLAYHDNILYAGTRSDGVWKYTFPDTPVSTSSAVVGNYFRVTPNLVTGGVVQLEYDVEGNQPVHIDLISNDGYLLTTVQGGTLENKGYLKIDVSTFPVGIYYFSLNNGKHRLIQPLVITK